MSEKEKELREMWAFLKDFWQLIKTYYTPDPDPEAPYWHDVINAASALGEQYKVRSKMLQANLINAFLDYLDCQEYAMRKERRQ